MNSKFFERLIHLASIAIFIGILVTGAVMTVPKFARARDLEAQREEVLNRIAKKNKEIAELKENQRRFRTDPEFVESIARRNRRVFPGELVFVFED